MLKSNKEKNIPDSLGKQIVFKSCQQPKQALCFRSSYRPVVTVHGCMVNNPQKCSNKYFFPFCTWKIPNREVLGLRMGQNGHNGTVHFHQTSSTEKCGLPWKVDWFFWNFSSWTELIHSLLDRNFWEFWLNGSHPQGLCSCTTKMKTLHKQKELLTF